MNSFLTEMKISKVCCQSCGASLDISEDVRFATCNYCHANLEIIHEPTITHSRLLENLDRRTANLAESVRVLELQNELEQLDRSWDIYREGALVRGKNGHVSEPSAGSSIIGGIVMIAFGIFFAVQAGSMGAPGIFPFFGVVMVLMAVFSMVKGSARASEFSSRQQQYEFTRRRLIGDIQHTKRRRNSAR